MPFYEGDFVAHPSVEMTLLTMPGCWVDSVPPVSQGESYLEDPSASPWKLRWEGMGPDEVTSPTSSSLQGVQPAPGAALWA